jgi:hypothetical protein
VKPAVATPSDPPRLAKIEAIDAADLDRLDAPSPPRDALVPGKSQPCEIVEVADMLLPPDEIAGV